MKTTNKYSAKLNQTTADSAQGIPKSHIGGSVPSYPRDIVLMRIRHIFKAAREV